MTSLPSEQRNPYKGSPQRPWVRIRLLAPDGSATELELIADTGSPCSLIISQQNMARLTAGDGPDLNSNFGLLKGGWVQLDMPQLGLVQQVLGYSSDDVVTAATVNHPDFEGLAGLPLLRLAEYGGNADWSWLRAANSP